MHAIELIYIPIWLDLLSTKEERATVVQRNLHSNMVRFIISRRRYGGLFTSKFTFQYG